MTWNGKVDQETLVDLPDDDQCSSERRALSPSEHLEEHRSYPYHPRRNSSDSCSALDGSGNNMNGSSMVHVRFKGSRMCTCHANFARQRGQRTDCLDERDYQHRR